MKVELTDREAGDIAAALSAKLVDYQSFVDRFRVYARDGVDPEGDVIADSVQLDVDRLNALIARFTHA